MSAGTTSFLHPERPPRILIVGDIILDRYRYGSTSRISPEAPIVVLAATREERLLGGCGNVAANLAALGAEVRCVAVVGQDESAARVRDLLAESGVDAGDMVTDSSRPTISKTRLVAHNQQLLRIDEERAEPLDESAERAVLERIEPLISESDVIVISDYGKGTLTDRVLDRLCRGESRPRVLVDPKGKDYTRYRGAHLLTPNRAEAEVASGVSLDGPDGIREAALALCRMVDLQAALITLGAKGMYCATADGRHEWSIPALARSVYDVTGAGDTVIAVLAYALANGAELEPAMRLATAAAGVVVQRFGVYAVTTAEIEHALSDTLQTDAKVVDREDLLDRIASERHNGRKIVFTNGCFDVLHMGHLEYLQEARSLGDVLVIAINDDASTRRIKGDARPVNRQEDRAALLAGFECVSFVTTFSDDTPLDLIEAISPDVLVKGADWQDKGVVGAEWVESHGGRVVLARLREGYSTTNTLKRLGGGEPREQGPR